MHEDKEKNLVTATFELPGLNKENVSIDVHNNALTVAGESRVSSERDEAGYAVRERRFGRFSRSIPLPQGVKVGRRLSFWFVGVSADESFYSTRRSRRRWRTAC